MNNNNINSDDISLVLLDAGITAKLSRSDRINFVDLFHCIVTNQSHEVGKLMMERSKYGIESCKNPDEFSLKMKAYMEWVES